MSRKNSKMLLKSEGTKGLVMFLIFKDYLIQKAIVKENYLSFYLNKGYLRLC